MNTAPIKLQLSGVKKSFGEKHVLNGIDLSIPSGKSLVVIGGSGTGKSVMIKCVLGLLQADKGTITIDGEDTGKMRAKERDQLMHKFGMLFQGGALFDSLKVWENVAFGLVQGRGMDRRQAREIAIEKIKAVGLKPEVGDLFPAELSGGMQKRVVLARAIAASPEIIFFDEPTTGLDPIMADVINDLIVATVKDMGVTPLSMAMRSGTPSTTQSRRASRSSTSSVTEASMRAREHGRRKRKARLPSMEKGGSWTSG